MLDVIYKLWCLWNFYIGNFDVKGVGKIIGEVVIFRFIEGNDWSELFIKNNFNWNYL